MAPKVTKFGKNLRFIRRLNGLSQTALANDLGLSRNNIASYESGMVEPSAISFLRFSSYFSITPEKFLEEDLSEDPSQILDEESSKISNFLTNHINDFTKQTNKITKILEGYNVYYQMKKMQISSEQEKELFILLDNILDLLENLVRSNWSLIQSIVPHSSEEE